MEVIFDDSKLALIETARAAETELPVSVIRWLRSHLSMVRAAPDERTLRNWRTLGYDEGEELFGRGKSLGVPPNMRLFFRLEEKNPEPAFVVVSLSAAN
jgi:toxin HigB-1